MAYSICSINYHRMKIQEFMTFCAGVKDTYYKHTDVFTSPPMTKADYEALMKKHFDTYMLFKNGGKSQKANYLIATTTLISALDEIADNVYEVAQGVDTVIMEGGFKPTKTFRSAKTVPHTPEIEKLERGADGQILAQCNMLGAEVFYGCLLVEGAPLDDNIRMIKGKMLMPAGNSSPVYMDVNKSRKKSFINLKSGTRYYVYFYALNTAGVSCLSEGRSIICG